MTTRDAILNARSTAPFGVIPRARIGSGKDLPVATPVKSTNQNGLYGASNETTRALRRGETGRVYPFKSAGPPWLGLPARLAVGLGLECTRNGLWRGFLHPPGRRSSPRNRREISDSVGPPLPENIPEFGCMGFDCTRNSRFVCGDFADLSDSQRCQRVTSQPVGLTNPVIPVELGHQALMVNPRRDTGPHAPPG